MKVQYAFTTLFACNLHPSPQEEAHYQCTGSGLIGLTAVLATGFEVVRSLVQGFVLRDHRPSTHDLVQRLSGGVRVEGQLFFDEDTRQCIHPSFHLINIMQTIVAPSVLNADHGNLLRQCKDVLMKGAEWLHMDIMDGHFVPNISFGMPVVASLRKHLPTTYISCHLMVTHPMRWLQSFHKAGASSIILHVESDFQHSNLSQACQKIKSMGMDAGVVIKPATPLDSVKPVLDQKLASLLLVMTVEPGFGGQKFMPQMMDKVREARKLYPSLDIKVDGGINAGSARIARQAGANILVSGTAIFNSQDRAQTIRSLLYDI